MVCFLANRLISGRQALVFFDWKIGLHLLARMNHDMVNVNAGYLAYITLLSIIPTLTVLLSALSLFAVLLMLEMLFKTL